MRDLKNVAFRSALAACGLGAILFATDVRAADHLDSSATLGPTPMADINDVYAWMTADGRSLNLIMTVSPGDNGTRHFGPGVQYVFHVTSKPGIGIGTAAGTETKILCTFQSDLAAKCWIGTDTVKDYVEGNPSHISGVTSFSGKVRLYAGRRSDPFFFNLQGFRDAIAFIKSLGTLTLDAAGCPTGVDNANVATMRSKLQQGAQTAATAPCSTTHADCFKSLKVQALILQVDTTLLLDAGHTTVAVWGSTHLGS